MLISPAVNIIHYLCFHPSCKFSVWKIWTSHKTFANKAPCPREQNRHLRGNWRKVQKYKCLHFWGNYPIAWFVESRDFWCTSRNLFAKCVSIVVYAHVFLSNEKKINCLNWAHAFLHTFWRIYLHLVFPSSAFPKIRIKICRCKQTLSALLALTFSQGAQKYSLQQQSLFTVHRCTCVHSLINRSFSAESHSQLKLDHTHFARKIQVTDTVAACIVNVKIIHKKKEVKMKALQWFIYWKENSKMLTFGV